MLPDHLQARIDPGSWPRPVLFDWLQREGAIEPAEMLRVFNCGVGMVVIVAPGQADEALQSLRDWGESAHVIGHIEPRANQATGTVFA